VKQLDKDKTYVVYCQAGGRSTRAAAKMKELGVDKLFNFAGSMNEWNKAGKPVEKGEEKPAQKDGETKDKRVSEKTTK
jgi:rhodanese-related sulfurtransferase